MSINSPPSSGRSSLQVPRPGSPPPTLSAGQGTIYPHWKSLDPRSSSSQSLAPSESGLSADEETRRTLLIVYIHGFMGNESSFRSFPAHVHSYLKEALAETHVIHSKIYPRYKTYKAIDVARDNFSHWLEPHESETTDVVLVGHSMGGLLAADVVLLPNTRNPGTGFPFQHRILGTISLDAPLLGLHPGIIVSGIASLFRPAPDAQKGDSASQPLAASPNPSGSLSPDPSLYSAMSPPSGTTSPTTIGSPLSPTSLNSAVPDPFFNPPFFNDTPLKDRGWFRNVAHFAKKHQSENIFGAVSSHLMSHLEFGGCLADYPGLNSRYDKLRRLEDVDPLNLSGYGRPRQVRVRFVNYFTISTGRPKAPKPPQSPHLKPENAQVRNSTESESKASTPRISIDDYSDSERPKTLEHIDPEPEPELEHIDPEPEPEPEPAAEPSPPPYTETATPHEVPEPRLVTSASDLSSATENLTLTATATLPAIPPLPSPPVLPDLDKFPDKDARKQAEKEGKRAQKAYDQAVRDRDKAIKERQRLVEKLRRKAAKEAEKREKEERKKAEEERKRAEKEEQQALRKQQGEAERAAAAAVTAPTGASSPAPAGTQAPPADKKKKERKFCMLPRKVNGARDAAWVQVYMEGVDEVGAHCGLFLPGPHYERLVGDVGSRIVGWVHDDATRRAIIEGADWRAGA